jgi:hypothetical protein
MKKIIVIAFSFMLLGYFSSYSEGAEVIKNGTLVSTDKKTQGNWKKKYGKDGAIIISDSETLSDYIKEVACKDCAPAVWAETTDDTRALLRKSSNSRLAACWFNGFSMEFIVSPKSPKPFDLTMYFVDWDSNARMQQIELIDPKNDSVLSKKNLSEFKDGVYLSWHISGAVKVRISNAGPTNAVVNGIFFDPARGK